MLAQDALQGDSVRTSTTRYTVTARTQYHFPLVASSLSATCEIGPVAGGPWLFFGLLLPHCTLTSLPSITTFNPLRSAPISADLRSVKLTKATREVGTRTTDLRALAGMPAEER